MASSTETDTNVQTVDMAQQTMIWTGNRVRREDVEATEAFISIVKRSTYQELLNDKTHSKATVWEDISVELQEMGFLVAETPQQGGVKCHQKWRNLKKNYENYLRHLQAGPVGSLKKPPPYFTELHEILSAQHPVYASFLEDTHIPVAPLSPTQSLVSDDDHDTDTATVRPKRSKRTFIRKEDNKVLEAITKMHKELLSHQRKTSTKLIELMKEQNQQRERLTNALIEFLTSNEQVVRNCKTEVGK